MVAPGEYQPVGNHGVALFPTVLVLDFDPLKYVDKRDMCAEFLTQYPHMQHTKIVRTPRNGYHVYTRKPAHFQVKKSQDAYPGVDFLSVGAYACGVGTSLDYVNDKGERIVGNYILLTSEQILECPNDFLLSLQPPATAYTQSGAETLDYLDQFIGECKYEKPAFKGTRGISAYKLAARGKDYGLPITLVYAAMRDFWNPRNLPADTDATIWQQCERAYKYGRNSVGSHTAAARFEQFAPGYVVPDSVQPREAYQGTNGSGRQIFSDRLLAVQTYDAEQNATGNIRPLDGSHDQISKRGFDGDVVSMEDHQHKIILEAIYQKQILYEDKKGMESWPKNTQGNVIYYLKNDPVWRGRIKYNEFSDQLEIKGRPSWRKDRANKGSAVNRNDLSFVRAWFSAQLRMEVPPDRVESALVVAADHYHPVMDYLSSIKWDGVSRLIRAFPDTLGCEDNEYTREVGQLFFISLVKRILEPGCKLDYIIVLESSQGTRKSTWVHTVGGDWASTGELIPGDKDTFQNMRGKWVIELPEIDATFSKADVAWLKKVLSTGADTYRPSFGPQSETIPRESVFVATINPSATKEYLRDTENRRYWPIRTGGINIELLQNNRDQYFAEALYLYRSGYTSWMLSQEAGRIAKREQELRKETDPWVEILYGWASAQGVFTTTEAFAALKFTFDKINPRTRGRMYQVLREIGFEYSESMHRWQRPVNFRNLM